MTNELVGIFGARGHGRDVLFFIDIGEFSENTDIVFVDDDEALKQVCGIEIVGLDVFLTREASCRWLLIAVSNGLAREAIDKRLRDSGVLYTTVVADTALISSSAEIGEGALISPYSVVSTNVRIGRHFHCNTQSLIAHDCQIGDYVTFAPGVRCNGCVHIDDFAYIGAGATIHQGTLDRPLKIGKHAVIGMGAVVLGDVAPGETVVGNPARKILKST